MSQTLALSTPSNAEPDPWYYYGGPGYYHGYYSPGFKEYPSYYYNNVDPSNLYTFTGPASKNTGKHKSLQGVKKWPPSMTNVPLLDRFPMKFLTE